MVSSIIAAFDFDHTLTDRDSLLPFLMKLKGYPRSAAHIMRLSPSFIGYALRAISRQGMKERILRHFIRGACIDELEAHAEEYVFQQLDHYLQPKSVERLQWHQAQGHRCLLISASLELYLKPWAALHGFEKVLASRLELNEHQQTTGRLVGLNCWGPEKVRRLIEYVGPRQNYQLYAYGDSRGDQELLALADFPYYRQFN